MYPLDVAAHVGDLAELQRLRAAGHMWTADECRHAAAGGHLELLQWARAHGCPWGKWTCSGAATNGHLELLQWARANGCPWDRWACYYAATNGHLELLQWARANGCPWDKRNILANTDPSSAVHAWVAGGSGDCDTSGAHTKSAAARRAPTTATTV